MGTKSEPSEFDCYVKAGLNEPIFTLRAKDPQAPTAIRMWVAERLNTAPSPGERPLAEETRYWRRIAEALSCASDMEAWRAECARVEWLCGRCGCPRSDHYGEPPHRCGGCDDCREFR